ncbi:low molecular weight phosphotyrosine protein phosphatase [Vibrio cholerae]|uniref:exopolysaccharide regulatory protein-tyrosine phosphatase VpsU n=1 Tax=Vibrio cholerae TaxID=666 RepID=UPI00115BEDEA|nr:exopolysaccharide regulatory protein-tyrosine phosphatase VpsU [Vibrio cholerae]TQP27041.1 low molecular weight phosphotyrosine protein phosphatase [Vibrio cholerae]
MKVKGLSVLVVCAGNLCRSPMAEIILRDKIGQKRLNIQVRSAGTLKTGKTMPDDKALQALQALQDYGYHPMVNPVQQVTQQDFIEHDFIYAMDRTNLADLLDICPAEHKNKLALFLSKANRQEKEVPDPYRRNSEFFQRTALLIESGAVALVDSWQEQGLSNAYNESLQRN